MKGLGAVQLSVYSDCATLWAFQISNLDGVK